MSGYQAANLDGRFPFTGDCIKLRPNCQDDQRQPLVSGGNPEGRWRTFSYDELMARDKVNLDIFWLRDESLEESANLPEPDVLAREIVEELGAALEQFAGIIEELGGEAT